MFNFYFPMMYTGFDTSNNQRVYDVFILMLSQMTIKQFGLNIIEYLIPIIKSKKKLENHKKEYADILKLYDDS